MQRVDVLVIGGGAAGVGAALAAVAAGARTLLVRAGPGASALCAGGWTSAPPAPVAAALAAAGLPLVECGTVLPHPDGRLLECAFAPAAHAPAALPPARPPVLVCGVAGLPGFHAPALAALWGAAAGLPQDACVAVTLRLPDTPPAGWSPVSLAAVLEREPELLAGPLAAAVRDHGATQVIVPAVLGIDGHEATYGAVRAAAGVALGEALAAAPSVPGWRLDRALLRALESAGVPVLAGRVSGHEAAGGLLREVAIMAQARTVVQPAAVVLATGKFAGGGIAAARRFAESALDLPVAVERLGRTFTDPSESLALTDPVRTEPQPVLAAGLLTDGDGHPVTLSGDVVFRNVFVAGSLRAGVETAALGLGAAAADGWQAGTRAAAAAGRA
jgi:anaerobic glycerol-3-phosphate dehydrogenase